jgi:hypothetical protein
MEHAANSSPSHSSDPSLAGLASSMRLQPPRPGGPVLRPGSTLFLRLLKLSEMDTVNGDIARRTGGVRVLPRNSNGCERQEARWSLCRGVGGGVASILAISVANLFHL